MILLGVNIDHVAAIRQARKTPYPDILEAAKLAQKGGADQITVHLREDRRHIQDEDLKLIRRGISVPLNLEMACVEEICNIAVKVRPKTATLVPERREEQTTERGLDLITEFEIVRPHIARLKENGIGVSLFIDPEEEQVKAASELKVHAVELHTGPFALAGNIISVERELERIKRSARLARKMNLKTAAGHGLHYENTPVLLRAVPEIEELNIGHAVVARAIFVGLENAVREMKEILK
jgi:pyridoxine 5-phosphate synthase